MKVSRGAVDVLANLTNIHINSPGLMAHASLGPTHVHSKDCAPGKCRNYKFGYEAGETTYNEKKKSFYFNIHLFTKTVYVWGTFTRA